MYKKNISKITTNKSDKNGPVIKNIGNKPSAKIKSSVLLSYEFHLNN